MEQYTIRDNEGAVICTGIWADNEEAAVDSFIELYPGYNAQEVYPSLANWND